MKKYLGPLSKDNPILVQLLGICSALAVTAQLKPAVVMALSVTVVCAFSNFVISLIRNTIPPRIRIIVQLLIVCFFGTYHNKLYHYGQIRGICAVARASSIIL